MEVVKMLMLNITSVKTGFSRGTSFYIIQTTTKRNIHLYCHNFSDWYAWYNREPNF